ncbi:hypothetical protein [Psychroserpens burtonensis]|nr:hypothetical protein [Psychroserpens burtonensis]
MKYSNSKLKAALASLIDLNTYLDNRDNYSKEERDIIREEFKKSLK